MSHILILILGCFICGFVIAYSLWISMRSSMLRADLQAIRAELDTNMRSNGLTNDKNYIILRSLIHELIEFSPYISIPIIWAFFKIRQSKKNEESRPSANAPSMIASFNDFIRSEGSPADVKEATTRVLVRVVLHLLLTPSTIIGALIISVFGRTEKLAKSLAAIRNDPRELERIASILH